MREICKDDFLMKCNSSLFERHSDSSDFEGPRKIPIVASKGGNHRLLNEGICNTTHETNSFKKHGSNTTFRYNTTNRTKIKTAELRTQQKHTSTENNKVTNERTKPDHLYQKITLNNSNKNHGDQSKSYNSENVNSNFYVRNKAMPCLSTIFRRRNNCTKHMSIIEEDQAIKNIAKDFERACCSNCERRRVKRVRRRRIGCSVQPVYNVEENIQGFPFTKSNNKTPTLELNEIFKNNGTEISNDLNISSKSELENTNPYKHNFFLKKKKKNLAENIQGFPFITNNNKSPLPELNLMSKNNGTDISYDLIISSNSELEKIKPYKHMFLKKLKKRHVKEKVIDYLNYDHDVVRNHQQQYPSKFQISPYQIFSTSSCPGKCSVCESESHLKMPSSSSTFWDFFARKVKNKIQNPGVSRSCDCIKPPVSQAISHECSPENCRKLKSHPENMDYYNTDQRAPIKNSFCQQTDEYPSQSSTVSQKKSKEPKVICKCYSNKKKRSKNDTKPCQEDHDNLTKAIAEKYNGEILCIHNPPCILINGCLNLPPPKMNVQGNLWPVTQSKKSSFAQMCQKMKRAKNKNYEQASQYHPPYTDVQEYLPEFKTEKIIQSICNHDPPCEIVHGCYKVEYDPKLQNSCIHVPMCQYLPACLMCNNSKDISTGSCIHHPKCAMLPMCSRKYITLTAKETVGTQVKPKAKMTCRHHPPCFMIPKCLAQAISGNYIPYGAIPGCVHHPCCEMIPACCRKSAKEMVSVPSQYPNACRIV